MLIGVKIMRRVAPLPTVARLLLLLALLGGVVTMHAVTFALGHDHDAPAATTATMQHHTTSEHAAPAPAPCDADDCSQHHTGLHECVFIMTAIAVIAGLTMLCWIGFSRTVLVAPKFGRSYRRRQRAPPWTVLSLHQLSILRV